MPPSDDLEIGAFLTDPILAALETAHMQFEIYKKGASPDSNEELAESLPRQHYVLVLEWPKSIEFRSVMLWHIIYGLEIPYAATG